VNLRFHPLSTATVAGLICTVAFAQQAPPFVFVLNASVDVQDGSADFADLGGANFTSPCDQPSGQIDLPDLHGGVFFANKSSTSNSATFTVRTAAFIARRQLYNWYSSFGVYALGPSGTHVHVNYNLVGQVSASNTSVDGVSASSILGATTGVLSSGSNSDVKSGSGTFDGVTEIALTCYGRQYSLVPFPVPVYLTTQASVNDPSGGIGSADATATATVSGYIVRPNQTSPTAAVGPIGGVSQNVTVALNGSNSHANTVGASIIEYRWDIQKADGTDTLFGSPISYSWNTAGTYLVTLTVTDSDGLTGSTNAVVTVFPPKMCAVDALTPLASLVQQYPELYQGSTFGLELNPIDTVHLQLNMQTALACFQGGIQGSGGTFVLKSAYRTNAYQAHLREVWDKWLALQPLAGDPTCAQVYSDVQAEFNKHGIVHRPASADLGPHTTGSAIDVCADGIAQSACAGSVPNPILSVTQTLNMADGCGLYRPVPTDPVHFVHK
jgi:hypothetical protein